MTASQPSRGALVAAQAEQWIGAPFLWQGRIRAGCDCKGLLAGIAAELGFAEAASVEALCGDYGGRVPLGRLRQGLARIFDPVAVAERRAGDVLLCRVSGLPQHLAVCAPHPGRPDRVIEALLLADKVRPFVRRVSAIDSAWRWRDVTGAGGGAV